MSGTALLAAEKHIRNKLLASAEIKRLVKDRIYRRRAKSKTAFPCIVFFYYTGHIEKLVGGEPYYTDCRYVVKYIDSAANANADAVDTGAALINAALTNVVNGDVFLCIPEEPHDAEYSVDGVDYEERGGIFNLAIAKM